MESHTYKGTCANSHDKLNGAGAADAVGPPLLSAAAAVIAAALLLPMLPLLRLLLLRALLLLWLLRAARDAAATAAAAPGRLVYDRGTCKLREGPSACQYWLMTASFVQLGINSPNRW